MLPSAAAAGGARSPRPMVTTRRWISSLGSVPRRRRRNLEHILVAIPRPVSTLPGLEAAGRTRCTPRPGPPPPASPTRRMPCRRRPRSATTARLTKYSARCPRSRHPARAASQAQVVTFLKKIVSRWAQGSARPVDDPLWARPPCGTCRPAATSPAKEAPPPPPASLAAAGDGAKAVDHLLEQRVARSMVNTALMAAPPPRAGPLSRPRPGCRWPGGGASSWLEPSAVLKPCTAGWSCSRTKMAP